MPNISRYDTFITNNVLPTLPFVPIITQATDKFLTYVLGVTRFDKLAGKYYGDSTLGWLILYANPNHGMEFDFDDGDILRIPFPLNTALQYYYSSIGSELTR